eukprot:SM000402S15229  [mRNA]  locus=s402:16795:19941:- [translate_table: standard]
MLAAAPPPPPPPPPPLQIRPQPPGERARAQVYDLAESKPTDVLEHAARCLLRLAAAGDACADAVLRNLRLLVAGGDGTLGWVLASVTSVRALVPGLPRLPCAAIPLGTGNDLSRSFGWGGGFPSAEQKVVRKRLLAAAEAAEVPLDSWQVLVLPPEEARGAPLKLPHAMHAQHHVPVEAEENGKDAEKDEFVGSFWNYMSIGMDAQVTYGFHHLRELKPWLARGPIANQMIYTCYGCGQGWFCTPCSTHPRLATVVRITIQKADGGPWEELFLPPTFRSVIILNLQSYAGGRDPWGKPHTKQLDKVLALLPPGCSACCTLLVQGSDSRLAHQAVFHAGGLDGYGGWPLIAQNSWVEARVNDGLLELVGLRGGWHTVVVMWKWTHATRLAQARAVRFELHGEVRKRAYLQIDGEPWQQPLARQPGQPTVIQVTRSSEQSQMVALAKSRVLKG